MVSIFKNIIHLDTIKKINFSTIHRMANSILYLYEKKTDNKMTIIENSNKSPNKLEILGKICKDVNGKKPSKFNLERLAGLISRKRNDPRCGVINYDRFDSIFEEYERIKANNNYIDFDDMIHKSVEYIESFIPIRETFQRKYQYILVDEAQDMSITQYKLLKSIANLYSNIMLVGDDDQSIYGSSGSDPNILRYFYKDFMNTKLYNLNFNRRCNKTIVETSEKLIRNNRMRFHKEIIPIREEKNPIIIKDFKNMDEQVDFIVNEIKAKYLNGSSNTAVLYRDNYSIIQLLHTFIRKGIPFNLNKTTLTFFRHWIKNDIIAILLLADDRSTIQSLEHIYNKLDLYLNEGQTRKIISEHNYGEDIFRTFDKLRGFNNSIRKNMKKFERDLNNIRDLSGPQAIEYILERMSYFDYIKEIVSSESLQTSTQYRYIEIMKYFARDTRNVRELWNRIGKFQKNIMDSNERYSENRIYLSSFHGAKGLEFDNVFLIDMNNGIMPQAVVLSTINKTKKNTEQLQESRRLMYVAMTRARDNLYLLSSSKDNVSMFIKEIQRKEKK